MIRSKTLRRQRASSVGAKIVGRLTEFTRALENGTPLTAKFTCRTVRLNRSAPAFDADRVRETRGRLHASQAVFAMLLGVSVKTVRAWEQGVNAPSDMANRFMDEIRRQPQYRGRPTSNSYSYSHFEIHGSLVRFWNAFSLSFNSSSSLACCGSPARFFTSCGSASRSYSSKAGRCM